MRVDYQIFLKSPSPTLLAGSDVANPDIFWGEMFDFRRITLFCLEIRLSKNKMTIFSKKLGGCKAPPWLRLCWRDLPLPLCGLYPDSPGQAQRL